jgi:carbon-monoxide dehydrogenase medium subunit
MTALEGRSLDAHAIAAARDALAGELAPPDDPAYPGDYKRRVAGVLLGRVLAEIRTDVLHA